VGERGVKGVMHISGSILLLQIKDPLRLVFRVSTDSSVALALVYTQGKFIGGE
jgi:hypothetical protein